MVFKRIFLQERILYLGTHKSGKSDTLLIIIQFLIRNHAIYMNGGFKICEEKDIFCFFHITRRSYITGLHRFWNWGGAHTHVQAITWNVC